MLVDVAHDEDTPTPYIQGDDNQLLASEVTSADNDLSVASSLV